MTDFALQPFTEHAGICQDHRSDYEEMSWFKGIFVIIILKFLFCPPVSAEIPHISFEHLTLEEGLSQSTILAILQDKEGYLWIGTQEGLNRYDGYNFTIYKNNPLDQRSISDNWITALLVDSQGDLWVGTNAGGLNLFDRLSSCFIKYRYDENDVFSISDDRISALYEDHSGALWVGTVEGGLNRFDRKNQQFERYRIKQDIPDLTNEYHVTAIGEDAQGNLMYGTNGAGLYVLDWEKSKLYNYKNTPNKVNSISHDRVSQIYVCRNGNVWIGTNGGGLNRFDSLKKEFYRYLADPQNYSSISDNYIYAILEDSEGTLWIGTDGGLSQFLPEKNRFYNIYNDPTDPSSLSNNMIRSIYEDSGGILWIGTYSGALNKFDRKKAVFKNYGQNPTKSNSLSDKNVWSIFEDNQNRLWIGTNNGLNRLDRNTDEIVHYFHNPRDIHSLGHDLVRTVYQDRHGIIWIGTEGGGLNRYDEKKNQFKKYVHDSENPSSISDNGLRHIFEDKEGNLWIATLNGLNKFDRKRKRFKRYLHNPNDPNTISGNHVRYIYQDRRGAIWVATFNGLSLYIKKKDSFISFRNNPANPSSLSNNRVLCLHEDRSGRFWIGTYGGGVNQLDREEFIFTHYTQEDGLSSNAVYGILEDQKGKIWMSTNQGISCLDPETGTFRNFDSNDGFQSNEFNGNAFFQNRRGEFFFGGIKGLSVFTPEEVRKNDHIPPVIITSFKIYDKEILGHKYLAEDDVIEMNYQDNFFSFEFAALDFTNPSKNQYLYRLEGFDKDWIFSGTRRFASYTNLNGGQYIFRVRGSNNDSVWNEHGRAIKLIIHPPFWQTWWFKLTLAIIILFMVYIFITLRMRSVNSQRKKLEMDVAQRTRELNQSNYELLRAKRDTDDILNNVEEGLFLLDLEYNLGSQYSRTLEKMLDEQSLSNTNFLKLLDKKISLNVVTSAREYLGLMFRGDVDEETLKELNPLVEVEINITDESESWLSSRYLSFNFKRIYDDSGISGLIVTVSDVTEQVILTMKLKQSEERTQSQMEWLVNILHIEPPLLNEFIEGVERELNYIDSLLKHSGDNGNFQYILEEIYRSMHVIKGNAALLDLKFFADLAHQFEDKITDVKRNSDIRGRDFVPLVLRIGEIRQSLKEVKKLIERMSHFHQHFESKKSQENDLLLRSIKNLISNLSRDLGKEVEFVYNHFDTNVLPYKYRLLVKEILVQLVRNALFHGIEPPQERSKNGKRPLATISLQSEITDKSFYMKFRDDGRGIQVEKLRAKAVQENRFRRRNMEKCDNVQIADLIFMPGFTTAEKIDPVAGRGIGLDLIRNKLNKIRGKIEVEFEEGHYCCFTVHFPLKIRSRRSKSNKNKKQGTAA